MVINILLSNYGRFPSGGFRIVYQYADALSGRGHKVRVIHPATLRRGIRQFPGYVRTWNQIKAGSEWYPFQNSVQMLYVRNLEEKNIPDADVTIATALETSYYLAGYGESKGKKLYMIQGYEKWAGNEEYVKSSWRLPMHKLVISNYLYEVGISYGLTEADMTYIPNPIDLDVFRPITEYKDRSYDICLMYSDLPGKGSRFGLEMLEQLKCKWPSLKVVMFGIAKRPAFLPEYIDYFSNPIQTDLIEKVYNQAKIFVCTSLSEGWGLPGMEAMACGANVVTTACGGVSNYAIAEQTALVVPIDDREEIPNQLAGAVCRLLEDGMLADRLREDGLKKVTEFSLDHSVDILLQTIERY